MTHRQPTLLAIFAHPDDESFGPGGTLARYAAEGAAVHVVIATDGIAGSVEDPSHLGNQESLAQVRSAELANAAVALGITSIWSLPYRDSGMFGSADNGHAQALVQQPLDAVTDEIAAYMHRLQPAVVITHDPFGGYGHPDHIHVCRATTAAFHQVRRALEAGEATNGAGWRGPQKLYYTAFDKRMLKVMVRLMPLWGSDPTAIGRNKDINLVEIASWDTPVDARVDVFSYLAAKEAASRAHASQYGGGPNVIRALPSALRRRYLSSESFSRAFPAPDGHVERDLLAGIG